MPAPDWISSLDADNLLGVLLHSLAPEVRDDLLAHSELRIVPASALIIESGKPTTELGYVIEGMLGMTQIVDPTRKHIIGILVATDLFGRLYNGPSTYRVEALSQAKLLCFQRDHFESVLRLQPEIERLFLVHLLDELDAAREWLLLISGRKVINRVASFLAILARRARPDRRPGPMKLTLPLTRKDMAHYLGTRPESLSRAFHELQEIGILRIIDPYLFEVLDPDALLEVSGQDLTIERAD